MDLKIVKKAIFLIEIQLGNSPFSINRYLFKFETEKVKFLIGENPARNA